ncbi:hypothetical protein K1719_026850 [Acacia pycnantha]|nr:hypothetical protein K1719_026850 [Acacia pycnantha]
MAREDGRVSENIVVRTDAGQMKDDGEIWRVVQRPRRNKKSSKEKQPADLRRVENGSRFDVLAEEGSGGDVSQMETGLLFVQGAAAERSAQRSKSEGISSDRKGETQKAFRKENRQNARKEKRTREAARREKSSRFEVNFWGRSERIRTKGRWSERSNGGRNAERWKPRGGSVMQLWWTLGRRGDGA